MKNSARQRCACDLISAAGLASLLLMAGSTNCAEPDERYKGNWKILYRVTAVPGQVWTPTGGGGTAVQAAFVTMAAKANLIVKPDGTFEAGTFYGTNLNKSTNTGSQLGLVKSEATFEAYVEARGKVEDNVIRLKLDQALGSGLISSVAGGYATETTITTTPEQDSYTAVMKTPTVTGTRQLPKNPGGYVQGASWGSSEWELKKTAEEGTVVIYRASRPVDLMGLPVVEEVMIQRDRRHADLELIIRGVHGTSASPEGYEQVPSNGMIRVVVQVTNLGPDKCDDGRLKIKYSSACSHAEPQSHSNSSEANLKRMTTDDVRFELGSMKKGDQRLFNVRFHMEVLPLAEMDDEVLEAYRTNSEPHSFFEATTDSAIDPNYKNDIDWKQIIFNPFPAPSPSLAPTAPKR